MEMNGLARRKTNEEFVKQVRDFVGSEYTFLEKYNGTHTRIKCKHNKCSRIYYVRPHSFLKGARCSGCFGGVKIDNESFVKTVYDLVKDEYKFLEEYHDAQTKIKVVHKSAECNNYEYRVSPNKFLAGRRCPACNTIDKSKRYLKTNKEFTEEIRTLIGNEYIFLEEYSKAREAILCKHNVCDYEWKTTPDSFLGGKRCPLCAGNIRRTDEEFLAIVDKSTGDEYKFLEPYVNSQTKIKCRHNKCGHEYSVAPNTFISGSRCPKCNESKGERKISDILNEYKVCFTPQYRFDNCRYINPLPFDFYLNELNMCIEFDGAQHFKSVEFFGGEEIFVLQQIKDNIKNAYCKENNIPLLRIPYWDYDNIESILEKELVKYGVLQEQITMMEMNW